MKFTLHRDRTIASTCGLSVEFKKGVATLVPPAMYAEVIAAGGISENELTEDEMPATKPTPEQLAEREQAMFKAFDVIVKRSERDDFTAGGVPHANAVAREVGWSPQPKELKATWAKYTADKEA